jgi:hypothetical protein
MSTIIIRKSTALVMALLVVMATSWGLPATTEARQVRNTTRTNVNRDVNVNRNVNRNVNVHRDIDVDVDHHYRGYHPVATAAAVAATATVTAAVGTVEGAVFGLLALLVAFTFSGAAARFDTRRQLIVEETNDIGTAYLRLDLLPAAAGAFPAVSGGTAGSVSPATRRGGGDRGPGAGGEIAGGDLDPGGSGLA